VPKPEQSYAIIKTRHDASGHTRVQVVKGLATAQQLAHVLDAELPEAERAAGWGHFVEECSRENGRAVGNRRRSDKASMESEAQ
jgi:hypothetical protein